MAEDDDYDPRKPPKTPHDWYRLNDGADKGAKSWLIVAPIYIAVTNWRAFLAALVVAGAILQFLKPEAAMALWSAFGGGQ